LDLDDYEDSRSTKRLKSHCNDPLGLNPVDFSDPLGLKAEARISPDRSSGDIVVIQSKDNVPLGSPKIHLDNKEDYFSTKADADKACPVAVKDVLTDNEDAISDQSLVTHIQSPTHQFIEKENDEDTSEDTGIDVDKFSPPLGSNGRGKHDSDGSVASTQEGLRILLSRTEEDGSIEDITALSNFSLPGSRPTNHDRNTSSAGGARLPQPPVSTTTVEPGRMEKPLTTGSIAATHIAPIFAGPSSKDSCFRDLLSTKKVKFKL